MVSGILIITISYSSRFIGHPAKADGQPNQEVVGHMASSKKKIILTLYDTPR